MRNFVVLFLIVIVLRKVICTSDTSNPMVPEKLKPIETKPVVTPKPDPCSDDEPCEVAVVNQLATPVIKKALQDSFSESHELSVGSIPGNFSTLVYHANKHNFTGLQNCKLTKVNISPDLSAAQFVLECPSYTSSGQYDLCGYFIHIPVMGKGDFEVNFGKHSVTVYSTIKRIRCGDKMYLQLGEFTTDVKALSPIKFNIQNLYNGNAYLSKIVNNFASCHWKEMSLFTNGPLWNNILIKIFAKCNEKLRKVTDKLFHC